MASTGIQLFLLVLQILCMCHLSNRQIALFSKDDTSTDRRIHANGYRTRPVSMMMLLQSKRDQQPENSLTAASRMSLYVLDPAKSGLRTSCPISGRLARQVDGIAWEQGFILQQKILCPQSSYILSAKAMPSSYDPENDVFWYSTF